MKPQPTYPAITAILPPQLFGSVHYYAAMARYGSAIIDGAMRYDKRMKSAHRFLIADVRGPLALTVPVQKPGPDFDQTWRTIYASAHNRWWEDMTVALESAYGRTPFFEFYRSRLLGWISEEAVGRSIADIDRQADCAVRQILGIDNAQWAPAPACEPGMVDFRREPLPAFDIEPYYQVRALKLGFIPGLSILDLIFNLGPEFPLIIFPPPLKTKH